MTPRKLGQHFLNDKNILTAIADAADIGLNDVIVEIGPGLGSLTRVVAERAARVESLELDGALVQLLQNQLPTNVRIHEIDARLVNIASLLGGCISYKLIGNLPYYAANRILRKFLESQCRPEKVVIMVQREVAQQMCAVDGSKSILSIATQLYGEPRVVKLVRPGSFSPPPKVNSAIVKIDVFEKPAEGVEDTSTFFKLVRAGFSAPRKQIRNSIANGLAINPYEVEEIFAEAGMDFRRRAETLSISDWANLHRIWIKRAISPEKS